MALTDQLKAWFERDVRFATWDENVKVDDSDPNSIDVRFYTDNNEYILAVSAAEDGGEPYIDVTVNARKPRAGQTAVRTRRILPAGRGRLDAGTWRRLIGSVVGLELVRVQRRESADAMGESDKENTPSPARGGKPKPARTHANS